MNSRELEIGENYYKCDGGEIYFYSDDDIDGYCLCTSPWEFRNEAAQDKIKEFYIPDDINGIPVTDIEGDLIYHLSSLERFVIEDDNEYFTLYEGGLYSKDMTKMYHMPPLYNDKTFIVPKGVHVICDSALSSRYIETLVIPEGCICLLEYAFGGDKELKTVYLPKSLEFIGLKAFSFTEVKDVFYGGSKDDREKIMFIDSTLLTGGAEWHFNCEIPGETEI